MAPSTASCRGFTHPIILLLRSSIQRPSSHSRFFFTAIRSPGLQTPRSQNLTRLFTTGRVTLKGAKPQSLPQSVAKSREASAASFAHKLALSKQGTVLYEGSPQRMFIASSFTAGFACMGAAAINIHYNVFNPPPGVPEWTAYAFGTLGLVLAILGMNFALMPSGIVRIIRVLPFANGSTAGHPKVQLEIMVRRLTPIPGFPLKRMVVEPNQIVMSARLHNPVRPPTELEKLRMNQDWTARKKAQKEYDDEHRMTIPFRDAKWAFSTIFTNIRRGLTGEGFAPVQIQGKKYKLDITNAYVFEEGRALDRLVKIEEDPKLAPLLSRRA
ncbi:hypothetical protein BX600DRAFT_456485 [Xylariales sp. PMI_506]|nr:hypothetical protein BX600DRAFT_456485 [Xylariales sp. PMI_506]